MYKNDSDKIRIIIVGAGEAGQLVTKDILADKDSQLEIVGFVDDDKSKRSKRIQDISVLGTTQELSTLVKEHHVDEILIAIPSERGKAIRDIVESTMGTGVAYKIIPRLAEVLMQDFEKDYLKFIRKIRPEDLLGGEILKSDQQEITKFARAQTILVTGAAGSIGSELCRQLAAHGTARLVCYDWWENGIFDLRNQLLENYPEGKFEFIIGDIKDRTKLNHVMEAFEPSTVFHAAAYKHVPLMESNPVEAVKNNILGTKTVAEIAIKNNVKKFILVSSDKAVNPTNVMGATKRSAEMLIHILAESQKVTTFSSVRFGNVINSNGSVIPIFEKQIEKGGPVGVTHKDVTRFFMTIPEAVHLILKSWVMGQNNDLFVLDMGESIKIYDLARLLIALQGYVPEKDIKIKIIGLRPGEKLYEEVLVNEEETQSTAVSKVFRTKNYLNFDRLAFMVNLNLLIEAVGEDSFDREAVKSRLKAMVSTYKPASEKPHTAELIG